MATTTELRVQTRPDFSVIDLGPDVFAVVDEKGLRIQMDNNGMMVPVCDLNWAQAGNLVELIENGKKAFA